MKDFEVYRPVTASPFTNDDSYIEIQPCAELQPYIRCFWGSKQPYREKKRDIPSEGIVVPDTCMDIIFDINFTDNRVCSSFCGIADSTFFTCHPNDRNLELSTFAIRFYAWSAVFFSEESMENTYNTLESAENCFWGIKKEIEPVLFDIVGIEDRIRLAEKLLLQKINLQRENSLFTRAMGEILRRRGNLKALTLASEMHVSSRQLERIFKENTGVSPKKLARLVRYQYLWNDVLFRPVFDIQNEVYELGYSDQAHLLNDFRKFHTMSLTEAKRFAMKDVDFLQ